MPDTSPSFVRLFRALPTPHVAVTPDMVVVDANDAYLALFGLTRGDMVGRPIVDVFPPAPDSLDTDGVPFILKSFHRAGATGRPDPMPVARYDIADPVTGASVERYWSHVAFPVTDGDGAVVMLVQALDEVTDYVLGEQSQDELEQETRSWRARAESVEAQLMARAGEVQVARAAEQEALALRAALAEAAFRMASAADLDELTSVLVDKGLGTVGATAGALAIRSGDVLRLRVSTATRDALAGYQEVPVHGPLPISVAAAENRAVLLPDRAACLAFGPGMAEAVADSGAQAMASFPLRQGAAVLGAVSFGWAGPQSFDPDDVEVMTALVAQCAQALARLQAREAELAHAAEAMQMSEALQRSLLTEPAQHPGLAVATRYRPARQQAQIGGDWYDSFATATGRIDVVVGDVSGHDQDAAALMGQTRNLLRGIAHAVDEPPALVLQRLDRALRDLRVRTYTTAVLATVDVGAAGPDGSPDGALVRWSNAGHPPPLLVRADGTVEPLETRPDRMLGVDPETGRTEHVTRLQPGDALLLCTDGLFERRTADLDAGLAWLVDAVAAATRDGLHTDALCDHLLELVAGHTEDDVVLLTLRVDPSPAAAGRPGRALWAAGPSPDAAPGRAWELTDLRALSSVRRGARHLLAGTAGRPPGTAPAEDVDDAVERAVLVVDELASNALRHGRRPAALEISDHGHSWLVAVTDAAPERLPVPAVDRPAGQGGYGLYVVADLSAAHGVELTGDRKLIWAEVPKPPVAG